VNIAHAPGPSVWDVAVAIFVASIIWLMIVGCGSSTARQTRTVERVETMTGPLVADTPVGQITIQPVRHVMQRTQHEQEQSQTTLQIPDVGGAIMSAGIGASPLGPLAGILGLLTATAAGWKAMQYRRQRNETIDGLEKAKPQLEPEQWRRLTRTLKAEQSADTVAVIHERTP
jgi:hypothetical protein